MNKYIERIQWTYFYPLLILALILRFAVALMSDQPFHFDEVMQYQEQAYRLVFGHGIVPWEYSVGLRSWLIPGFLAGFIFLGDLFHLDYMALMKIALCLISLSIPIGSYAFARKYFNEESARIAFVFTCFWYELIIFSNKALSTPLATALIFFSFYLSTTKRMNLKLLTLSTCLVLAFYVRLQFAPITALLFVVYFFEFPKKYRLKFLLSTVLLTICCGFFDYLTLGAWFHSPIQNIKSNLIENVASSFGTSPFYEYFKLLLLSSSGLVLVLVPACKKLKQRKIAFSLIFVFLLSHSAISHKEYRFIFFLIPLWLILCADYFSSFSLRFKKWGVALVLLVSVLGLNFNLLGLNEVYKPPFVNGSFFEQRVDLKAMRFVSKENDFYGFGYFVGHFSLSGGHYYLKQKGKFYDRTDLPKFENNNRLQNEVSHFISDENVKEVPGFKVIKEFSSKNNRKIKMWKSEKLLN